MKIILASASPRRRELMKLITDDFTAVSTDSDESLPDKIKPAEASEYLALLKAVSALKSYPDDIIILQLSAEIKFSASRKIVKSAGKALNCFPDEHIR